MKITRPLAMAAALLATVALPGCGSDNEGGTPASGPPTSSMPGMDHGTMNTMSPSASATASANAAFNDADVAFATAMIPHHGQAIEMADLALQQAASSRVTTLAKAIKAAQNPEIRTMSGWLTAWGKPVPAPTGMQHDGQSPMPGMMTTQEMADLEKTRGADFDRMWVQMMIKHHQGAVTMAKTEQTAGTSAQAIDLATKIAADQTREIATLQRVLVSLTTR